MHRAACNEIKKKLKYHIWSDHAWCSAINTLIIVYIY